jgi:aspartyl-tRNA(Asn)/glutamyl-tRNA(Gln) amidotransferase subunit C
MAVSTDDVKKLAELSRLALSEGEIEKLRTEIDSIVSYIDAVQKIPLPEGVASSPHLDITNVMRDDVVAHEGQAHSDALTAQFPDRDGDYLRVKKILG